MSRLCPWDAQSGRCRESETVITMPRPFKLKARLQAVASFIEDGASVVDVGTDHGYLPVYLAQNGLARRIIASDSSAMSLESARRSAAKYGVTEAISFIAAPGLSGVGEEDADTVVIAGVGGETIVGILEDAPHIKRGIRFILQPQTKIELLRRWLQDNGYHIAEEKQASDRGREYTVLLVLK